MNREEMNNLVSSVFDKPKAEYIGDNVIAFQKTESDAERQTELDEWYQSIIDHISLIETNGKGAEFHKQEAINRVQMLLVALTGKHYE